MTDTSRSRRPISGRDRSRLRYHPSSDFLCRTEAAPKWPSYARQSHVYDHLGLDSREEARARAANSLNVSGMLFSADNPPGLYWLTLMQCLSYASMEIPMRLLSKEWINRMVIPAAGAPRPHLVSSVPHTLWRTRTWVRVSRNTCCGRRLPRQKVTSPIAQQWIAILTIRSVTETIKVALLMERPSSHIPLRRIPSLLIIPTVITGRVTLPLIGMISIRLRRDLEKERIATHSSRLGMLTSCDDLPCCTKKGKKTDSGSY
jgi:hypothetical protein